MPSENAAHSRVALAAFADCAAPFEYMNALSRAAVGAVVWIAFTALQVSSLRGETWADALLLFSALVLLPLALPLFADEEAPPASVRLFDWAERLQWLAGLFLAAACWLPRGPVAGILTLPWVGLTALLAAAALKRMQAGGMKRELHWLCADVALMFLLIGGLWLLADRGGISPPGFESGIVGLTAGHFHYAGLLLPLFAGLAQRELWMSRMAARAAVGVVLGVPATAFGITATQLGWSPTLEAGIGCGLALAGMGVAVLHVRLALDAKWAVGARVLIGVAGASLFFAMVLTALYSSRAYMGSLSWLGLPEMRAWHGTVMALGFGLGGVLGWRRIGTPAAE